MRRWTCPTCGAGTLAPDAPRRDDVRRYCLDCSARTGRLVQRTCPALDRRRAAATTKRAARARTKRERDHAAAIARWTVGPYDLVAELYRYQRLPFCAALRQPPTVEVRRSPSKPYTSGHCAYTVPARIVLTVGTDPHDAVGTLIHELAHAVLLHEGHSHRFWSLVRQGARE